MQVAYIYKSMPLYRGQNESNPLVAASFFTDDVTEGPGRLYGYALRCLNCIQAGYGEKLHVIT